MPHPAPVVTLPGTDAQVLSAPDGAIVLRLSCGRFVRAQDPPPDLLDAVADEQPDTDETAAYVQTLRSAIASREAADAESRWPLARRAVTLAGAGTIIDGLADALRGCGADVRRFATAHQLLEDRDRRRQGTGTDDSLVIAYADTPRERAGWERLDELPRSGCAWLRAYREGQLCFVDPLSVSDEDPSSAQVFRRRLAAAPTPDLFMAWHEADAHAHAEPLTASAQALITARVLTVALAWAQEGEAMGGLRSTLWKFVPATGRISEHTVLGYDAPYLPEDPVVCR